MKELNILDPNILFERTVGYREYIIAIGFCIIALLILYLDAYSIRVNRGINDPKCIDVNDTVRSVIGIYLRYDERWQMQPGFEDIVASYAELYRPVAKVIERFDDDDLEALNLMLNNLADMKAQYWVLVTIHNELMKQLLDEHEDPTFIYTTLGLDKDVERINALKLSISQLDRQLDMIVGELKRYKLETDIERMNI